MEKAAKPIIKEGKEMVKTAVESEKAVLKMPQIAAQGAGAVVQGVTDMKDLIVPGVILVAALFIINMDKVPRI